MKAVWKGAVLAESEKTAVVENNHYFPPDSISKEYFRSSNTHTICPWKGEASYYHIIVGNQLNADAAWYYPAPKQAAAHIKNYLAFWHDVEVSE
ncbi:DUF427 domain-containing protein [Nitrosococcus watsonii]|uniref:DUF427 domain-containing protein n=1 Tax=Nitrosococcus watsoni (strain C-113) TaxID=105559 RepID=D8K8H9_NITWC|nr:DUF427 domain-containing protein [Nitrosococcus watsonii]ADJ29099.1 protein of unknown function DUF427 [Nitrosococcus watsonii C-113]